MLYTLRYINFKSRILRENSESKRIHCVTIIHLRLKRYWKEVKVMHKMGIQTL